MNIKNLYISKIHIIFFIVGIIGVFLVFALLLNRQNFETNSTPNSLTEQDIASINSVVETEMSDVIPSDELRLKRHEREGDWVIALVYSTNDLVEPNFVLLKNNGTSWDIAYGPASDYYKEDLINLGVPTTLIDKIDSLYTPEGYPSQ